LDCYPWAKAAQNGHVGQVNANDEPTASSSDVVSAAADNTLLNVVHPTSTVRYCYHVCFMGLKIDGSGIVVLFVTL